MYIVQKLEYQHINEHSEFSAVKSTHDINSVYTQYLPSLVIHSYAWVGPAHNTAVVLQLMAAYRDSVSNQVNGVFIMILTALYTPVTLQADGPVVIGVGQNAPVL